MVAVLSPRLTVRAMKRDDLAHVEAIETASYPFPWTRGIFQDCLRVGYTCRVLLDGEARCGYGIVSIALEEAHLLNLCIHPDRRREGLAATLLEHLINEALLHRASRLFLEVRPSNAAAVALYRSRGFRVIGRRPGYYPDRNGREDAVVMVLHLDRQQRE